MPEEFLTDAGCRIRTANLSEDDYRVVRFFLNHLERVAEEVPSPKAAIAFPCEIDFVAGDDENGSSPKIKLSSKHGAIRIKLPAAVERWEDDPHVQRRLLLVTVARRLGRVPTPRSRLPEWVLAALSNKLSSKLNGGGLPGPKVYPAAHGLIMNGVYPNVWDLIEHAPPVSNEPVNGVYDELCELLWNAIGDLKGDHAEATSKMLLQSLGGDTSDETLFFNTLGRLIVERNSVDLADYYILPEADEGDAVQWWFQRVFRRRAVNLHMPGDVRFARREFERIKSFDYLPVIADDAKADAFVEPAPMKLEDLAEQWDGVAERGALINKLRRNFTMLKYELPEEFYPSFNLFLEGFEELRDGDVDDFGEAVERGNQAFELGVVKRQALEDYLKEIERTIVPPGIRWGRRLDVIAEARRRGERFWPKLNRYLDGVEAKFGKPSK